MCVVTRGLAAQAEKGEKNIVLSSSNIERFIVQFFIPIDHVTIAIHIGIVLSPSPKIKYLSLIHI